MIEHTMTDEDIHRMWVQMRIKHSVEMGEDQYDIRKTIVAFFDAAQAMENERCALIAEEMVPGTTVADCIRGVDPCVENAN